MPEPKTDVEAPEHGSSQGTAQHLDQGPKTAVAAKLRNPMIGMSEADVLADVDRWVELKGLQDHREAFHKGGLIARVQHREDAFEEISILSEGEKQILRDEIVHKWRHPFRLYFLCVLCAGKSIVAGSHGRPEIYH